MKIKTSKTLIDKMNIVEEMQYNNVTFQIIELDKLEGAYTVELAKKLFFAQQSGLKTKMVRILMEDSTIKTEAGALYFYMGDIKCENNIGGTAGLVKKVFASTVTSESVIKPLYKGSGEIWLEPSFKHYIMLSLDNESIIIDKGMFYCCSGDIEVKAYSQKNISSALLGGEGFFQLEVNGTGIVVLEAMTPQDEIIRYDIEPGEVLKVDGNFAIVRTKNVDFTVTKSNKSLIGSAMNGEGFLNTFTCSKRGQVWLAPTAPLYTRMSGQSDMYNYDNKHINNHKMN